MRRTLLALSLACLCGCGGKTEAADDTTPSDSGTDAAQDSSLEAATDSAPEASQDSPIDASPWAACFGEDGMGTFAVKECQGASSCLVKEHQINCCGTMIWMGVAAGDEAAFDACEAAWRDHFPGCGCASEATKTEQPATAVPDITKVDVGCMNCTMESCVCMTFPK